MNLAVTGQGAGKGRIALIHALTESMAPIATAFENHWPNAPRFDLLDSALSRDRATGDLAPAITARVLALTRYAVDLGSSGVPTAAILFTGTAFGPALAAARGKVGVPILSPNGSAFDEAAASGRHVALLVTFPPSEAPLTEEMQAAIDSAGAGTRLTVAAIPGALRALQSGDAAAHDELIANAARATDAGT